MLVESSETDAALIAAARDLATAALDDDADAGMSRIDEATRSAARSFLTKAFDTAFDEQPEPDADEIDDEARD